MEFRNVGRSGLRVSVVGLGCSNLGGRIPLDAAREVVAAALDGGVTLFDTADAYGEPTGASEIMLGQLLGPRRKDVVVATKFGRPMDRDSRLNGTSRRYIMTAVEASLRRLNTDWIDLYQLHFPDPQTPLEETMRALDDLVRQGKVRYIGCSNLPAWQVVESRWISAAHGLQPFISCQDEYSLIVRDVEREQGPAMTAHGLGLLTYFPLASGLLTGKYRRDTPPPADSRHAKSATFAGRTFLTEPYVALAERLTAFAQARGHTTVELAFAWLLSRPFVSSILAGATKAAQVNQNIGAIGWRLTDEDLDEINQLTKTSS